VKAIRFGLLLSLAGFLSACIGSTTYHTATPIPEGTIEIGVMPGVYGVATDGGSITVPNLEFGLRTGLTENMDLGVRINGITLTTDLNIAVINDPGFALSINPAISILYLGLGDASFLWTFTTVGILADVVKTEGFTLMTGLKPGFIYLSGSVDDGDDDVSASVNGFTMGLTVGAKFRLTKNFALMPNVDVMTPVDNFGEGIIFNAGIGLLF